MAPSQAGDRKIACVVCRRRKIACDRRRPSCGFCTRSNFDCEYVATDRQPGVRAGYVAQLEQRIVMLEQRMLAVEGAVPRDGGGDHAVLNGTHHDGVASLEYLTASSPQAEETERNSYEHPSCASSAPHHNPLPAADLQSVYTNNQDHASQGSVEQASLVSSCHYWIDYFHPWFPILHPPTLLDTAIRVSEGRDGSRLLVLEAIAIAALESGCLNDTDMSGFRQRQEHAAKQLVIEALGSASLDAVQAMLVLSILEYGNGRAIQAWNMLAMCRRIGVSIGLRELVDTYASTTTTSPTALALQRTTSVAYTTIEHEELVRAYWMTEMLDSMSSIGSKHELGFLNAPSNPLLPCSDSVWTQPADVIGQHPLRPSHYSSAFSLCVMLALSELQLVHQFVRKPVAMESFEERDAWQSEAQRIDERLTVWRDDFVAAVYRLINAEKTEHERPEMDPFFVLTNCVLNTAVITLLQRRAACPSGVAMPAASWAYASNRCVYACENTAFKIRQMKEEEMLFCNPHLVFSIFVAARFYIVHSKAMDADVPVNLHSLAYTLHVCGSRWPVAKSYEAIIRIAVAEYRTPIEHSRVPREFFDMQYTTLEISEGLKHWAAGLEPGALLGLDLPNMST